MATNNSNAYSSSTNSSSSYSNTRDFEFTYDMWKKQMDINNEIANNKSGYMGVETMTMKEFYDAGGYAFVDDYKKTYNQLKDSYYTELEDIDKEYDRALTGYGVQGENMAQAGLTSSGYSDYMTGQAYAARVGARGNARSSYRDNLSNLGVQYAAANNGFRAAYNQYVRQQQEQQWNNMLTVVQNAYDAGQTEAVYHNYATAVGIPSELVDRGLEILRALNAGRTSGENLTAEDIYYKQNSKWGLTQSQEQTAMSLYADLYEGIFGTTDASGNTTGLYADLDQALVNLPSSYTPEIIAAAEEMLQEKVMQDIESNINMGYTISKAMLDRYAQFGVFGEDGTNSAEYKELLSQVQANTINQINEVTASNDTEKYKALLASYGYDASELDDVSLANMTDELVELLYEEGEITQTDRSNYWKNKISTMDMSTLKELLTTAEFAYLKKEELGENGYNSVIKAMANNTDAEFRDNNMSRITITADDGNSITYGIYNKSETTGTEKAMINYLNSSRKPSEPEIVTDGTSLYAYDADTKKWRVVYAEDKLNQSGTAKNYFYELTDSEKLLIYASVPNISMQSAKAQSDLRSVFSNALLNMRTKQKTQS